MSEEPQNSDPKHTWHDDTPFPRHWIGYVAIKVIVIVVAVVAALWWYGLL